MRKFRQTSAGQVFGGIPLVIRSIIGICAVIWLIEVPTWRSWQELWSHLMLYRPLPELWQLISYQFLHSPGDPFHLILNMVFLWMFGRELEQRWGPKTFLQFYLACGVGAGLAHVLLGMLIGAPAPVLGASGAVLGVTVAWAMTWPERTVLFMLVFPMKAKHLVILIAAIEILVAYAANPLNNVANVAHLGGMATAYLYMKQAWRLSAPSGLFGGIKSWFAERQRRRRVLRVVDDEKKWDEWLKDEMDDKPGGETRH